MADNSKISWCDASWNPIRGCSRVSEGCRNCYAERTAYRFSGEGQPYEGLAVLKNGHASWTGEVKFVEEHLLDPIRCKKPRKIFVNSMSDLFHENVTDEMRDKIFAVMALAPQHIFQCLTKRPANMKSYLLNRSLHISHWESAARSFGYSLTFDGLDGKTHGLCCFPLPNVWMGVSVENQATADERLPLLAETPARIRFVSYEPALGPVDITRWINRDAIRKAGGSWTSEQVDWAIVGGESGPGARPMMSQWADSIREQCESAGVAYYFKQNGEWVDAGHKEFGRLPAAPIAHYDSDGNKLELPIPQEENADVVTMKRVGRKRSGDTLYGKIYHEFPA